MSDYLTQARQAARMWREDHGLPVPADLLSLPALLSPPSFSQFGEVVSAREHSISRVYNATKEIEETKGREEERDTPSAESVHYLRLVIRRWFTLAAAEADGQRVGRAEPAALYQQIIRLQDVVGPAFADAVILEEHRRFRWETARCGWCGHLGHDSGCR